MYTSRPDNPNESNVYIPPTIPTFIVFHLVWLVLTHMESLDNFYIFERIKTAIFTSGSLIQKRAPAIEYCYILFGDRTEEECQVLLNDYFRGAHKISGQSKTSMYIISKYIA